MGFPRWTVRCLEEQQIVIYEGAAKFESGNRKITATDGLVIYARPSGETGVVQGFGEIELFEGGEIDAKTGKRKPDLIAKSNDGMILTIAADHQDMQLGLARDQKSTRWREHRYSVTYGDASIRGVGSCQVRRTDERVRLELRAPFDEIQADFDEDGTQLRNVRQLLATLEGKVITDLDVGGLPVRATFQKDGEVLQAQAPRLRQIGPRSMRLLPMDPRRIAVVRDDRDRPHAAPVAHVEAEPVRRPRRRNTRSRWSDRASTCTTPAAATRSSTRTREATTCRASTRSCRRRVRRSRRP